MSRLDASPADPRRSAAMLFRALRGHPWVLLWCVTALVAQAVAGLLLPIGIGMAVDVVAAHRPLADLLGALSVLVAGGVGSAITAAASESATVRVTEPAVAALRESALGAVLDSDAAAVERTGSGDVVTRLTADVERLSEAASGALGVFVSALLSILAALVGLAALDWRFAIAGLLAVPIQVGTLRWYLRRSAPLYRQARTAESARTQRTLDAVHDAAAIRALRIERGVGDEVGEASVRARDLEASTVRLSTRFYGRLNVAEFVGLAAICVVGFVLVGQDAVTLGAATTAALFFVRLFDPINTVLGLFDTVQQAGASLARLVGLVGDRSLHDEPRLRAELDRSTVVGVTVSDLGVSFAGRGAVLDGIHLQLRPGERIAVVGATGAGKTTLARVIAGLVPPDRGRVDFVDADGRAVHAPHVVLLEQRTHVFAGTLRDDLRLVAPAAAGHELVAAAELAGIRLGSGVFADGLDSVVGAGSPLTAADAQHLALARLALAKPALAILDEASADAGSAAARRLERAIDRISAGLTTIVIAHRLTQAAAADRVVLLEHGRLIACAPHAQMLSEEPSYVALWDAWSRSARHPIV